MQLHSSVAGPPGCPMPDQHGPELHECCRDAHAEDGVRWPLAAQEVPVLPLQAAPPTKQGAGHSSAKCVTAQGIRSDSASVDVRVGYSNVVCGDMETVPSQSVLSFCM